MSSFTSFFTLGHIAVILGAINAIALAVEHLTGPETAAYKMADKVLAVLVDLNAFFGVAQKTPSPAPSLQAVKTLLVLLALGSVMVAAPARAAPPLHFGPSVSLYEMRLTGQVGQLAPGLGVQGWASWTNWCAGLAVFGSALHLGTAHTGAALSLAPYGCYSPWGVCLGPGLDLAGSQGGLGKGFTWKNNFFIVANLLPKFFELLHFSSGA